MKIACIATSRVPSDTANSIQVMKACQGLAQLGYEIELLLPGSGQASWAQLADHYGLVTSFKVEWLPARISLRRYDFSIKAVRLARRRQADLVYAWPLQAAVAGLYLDMPVVLELHGPPEGRLGPRLFRSFVGRSGNKRFCPITRALLDILARQAGRPFQPGEYVIAPNGVDLERFSELPDRHSARSELGLAGDTLVGYTGHLYPGRGMDLLVELARRHPDLHFIWVGGRPGDVAYWESRLEREEIRNVRLTGFVENIRLPAYQAAMDVLLMPYERVVEGSGGGNSAEYASPMKMFEYMAAGRAIISSDLPPLREVLEEDLAVLCPPEDPQAWSAALTDLIASPARRQQLGENARRKVEVYTWTARQERVLQGFI